MQVLALLLAAVVTFLAGPAPAQDSQRVVSVSGIGRIAAEPDMAFVEIGVRREAPSAGEAMADASQAMRAMMEQIEAGGVLAQDVQTTRIGLDPRWQNRNDGSPPLVVSYAAYNDLRITVRDLERLGNILDRVVSEGASTVNGLSFAVSERERLEDEARSAAVEDARRKALLFAQAAGATLGSVHTISEGGGIGRPAPMFEASDALRSAVPVAAGQIDIIVQIQVVFLLTN